MRSISAVLVLSLAAGACSSFRGADLAPLPAVSAAAEPPVRSAGNLAGAAKADRDGAAIAALRAKGPKALDALFREYDALAPGAAKDALAATIDRVARQRYATVSRLFWHTDLAAAKGAAKAEGKPILSLRMLGSLDEDLSCANSRLFRTVLYANAAISKILRESFVLHWSSERPVPRVTIDFGDGRRIENTVTGNSAHYVLGSDGAVLDVLPGMYAPSVFRAELEGSLALARAAIGAASSSDREEIVRSHHRKRAEQRGSEWSKLGRVPFVEGRRQLLTRAGFEQSLALAQFGSMSKAKIEVPMLRSIDLGTDPGSLADAGIDAWSVAGQRLFGIGDPPVLEKDEVVTDTYPYVKRPAPPPKHRGGKAGLLGAGGAGQAPEKLPELLDAQSRALVEALVQAGPAKLEAGAVQRIVDALAQSMVADAAKNEMTMRQQIRWWLSATPNIEWAELNTRIYATLFHTPAEDPWLGLRPQATFTGLPGDGVAIAAPAR